MDDHLQQRFSRITQAVQALYELVLYLRGEDGCPWDRAQGLENMLQYLKEEHGELAEAVEKADFAGISEEWGDTFFVFLMFAAIAEESGSFDTEGALRAIEAKMIRRHPHVFGSANVENVEELLEQWDHIKAKEKQQKSQSLMERVPEFYSALKRAHHVQKAAAEVGFDWPAIDGILSKLDEETREIREARSERDKEKMADELGDLLFSCVNLARFMERDAEVLLNKTVDKFIQRFKFIEKELKGAGKSPEEASLEEMDALWEKAKKQDGSNS